MATIAEEAGDDRDAPEQEPLQATAQLVRRPQVVGVGARRRLGDGQARSAVRARRQRVVIGRRVEARIPHGGQLITAPSLKIGRYMEITRPPMITPRKRMTIGSISVVRLATMLSTSSS